uniref:DUF4200 domain-containing protein n=1 Tax=Anas platyrhynchos TaxID=8839 RepID=A0A8B9SZE8_ANAPL
RKLRLTEEDSLCPFIRLQEKKKQAQQMQKTLEEKEEVRRAAGSWWWLGWLVVSWRVAAHRQVAAGTGAMPCSLWPCQAFRERMKAIACQWRDLQIKEAQLKAYMKKSRKVLQENDKLRTQALKKARREREMKMQKQSELLRAKTELEALKNKHQKLSDRVQKYSVFSKYLEDVVKTSHESRWAHIQKTATQRTLELGTIRMAILNLFYCICKQMKRSLSVPADDNHMQLNMVEPTQTLSPCPERGAAITLSPAGWEGKRTEGPTDLVDSTIGYANEASYLSGSSFLLQSLRPFHSNKNSNMF